MDSKSLYSYDGFIFLVQSCLTLCDQWTAARQGFLALMISWTLLKLMSIELMFIESIMLSNHLILCHPLLHLPSIFPSICVFFSESVLRIRQPKYYSFTISSSCEYSGLISFRIDWFDLFEVQGTLKSLLQTTVKNISSSALSLLYGPTLILSMTTGKTIALTIWAFVSEVMSMLFNMLSRLVIAFLPGSKRLLIPCLQSPSAVILEPRKIKALAALFPYLFAVKWWDWMPWS